MGRTPFPTAASLVDELVSGVGESVQCVVAKDGVVEEAEPLLHGPVGGGDEAGDPLSVDYQPVEVQLAERSRFGGRRRYQNPNRRRNLALTRNSVTLSKSGRTVRFKPRSISYSAAAARALTRLYAYQTSSTL